MKRLIAFLLAVCLSALMMSACDTKLELNQTELSMVVGDSEELSVGNAAKVTWTSSDSSIVTVNAGLVTAKKAGSAVVTASLEDGTSVSCNITVADKQINVITLDIKSARLEEGKTIQLIPSFAPADATDKKLSWSSSNENVAVVDENGYVTGIGEGVAEIACESSNGVRAACHITVSAIEPPTEPPTMPPTVAPTTAPTEMQQSTQPTESSSAATTVPSSSSNSGFIFPDSSSRYLTESEVAQRLAGMSGSPVSSSFAQDAINEIFARNGYIFRTPAINAYFMAQSWYHPDQSYDGSLSPIEASNIALLSGY